MAKFSRPNPPDVIFKVLLCFLLLRISNTTTTASYFNFDLNITPLSPTTTGFTITGSAASDLLGYSVNTAGDINNDGYDDIIFGAHGAAGTKGIAYVIYGGKTSSFGDMDLSTFTFDPLNTGFKITGNAVGDQLGYFVSTAGDIDNDGYDDIIIGANGKDSNKGTVYVIYGGKKSSMQNIDLGGVTLDPLNTGFKVTGSAASDDLGWSVSTAGDINKDGYDDIIIGAKGYSSSKGAAYVIYGGLRAAMQNWDFSSGDILTP